MYYHRHVQELSGRSGSRLSDPLRDRSRGEPGSSLLVLPDLEGLSYEDGDELMDQVARRNHMVADYQADGDVARFGLLPFPYLEAALQETARVFSQMNLDGACMVPIAAGRYLDEAEYLPLLEELNRREARLLLHPADSSGEPLLNPGYLDSVLALSRLLYHDRIRRLDKLSIILAHDCGVAEFLADNIGMLYYLQEKRWRMGSFLIDFLFKKKLKGADYIRRLQDAGS